MTDGEPIGIATYSQSGNDLSWVYWCDICMKDDLLKWSGCNKRRIVWSGYNDSYWWNKVSNAEQTTIRTTPCGKKLRITHRGFVSEEVFEVRKK